MHIKKEISPKKVQQDAEENFRKGFYCCEALICAIRDNFELDVSRQVIAMASGMAVGAGQAGCMCALKTAQIIVRELGLTNLDEQPALDK